jgi:Mrp family chromosome partitioning ATPase/capsular polysaccharide biosynthesis protein
MEISGTLQGREEVPAIDITSNRESPEETFNLRDLVGILWIRKWILVASVLACSLLAYIAAELMTPIYTGRASVLIKPRQGGATGDRASLEAAILGGPEAVPTEAIVLQSRNLARRTIERLHLDRDPEFATPAGGGVASTPAAADRVQPSADDGDEQADTGTPADAAIPTAVVDAFLRHLLAEVEPRSNVISVSFKSMHPATAALVPNTLLELYLDGLVKEKNRALVQESKRVNDIILPLLRQKMLASDAQRTIYEQYLARSEEARSDIGHERPDAAIISRADVPAGPSFPNVKLMVLAATGLGGGIGLVLVLLIEAWFGGLRSLRQMQAALGVRCLGAIPMQTQDGRGQLGERPWHTQDSAFGHAVRSIQVKLRNPHARAPRVILVTGALAGEGKTWTAVSLAASLIADGCSVVIVDCDLQRPAVHRALDDVGAPGLTDYLAGAATVAQILHCDRRSRVPFVPAGAAKGACRLDVDRLKMLVDKLQDDYSFVILDAPPVLAVAETMQMAWIAARTLLIVRWGSTIPRIARHALRQLVDGGAEVSVVLSMVDVRRAASYGDPVAGAYRELASYYDHCSSTDQEAKYGFRGTGVIRKRAERKAGRAASASAPVGTKTTQTPGHIRRR